MKVNITAVGEPWRAIPESDALYTITIEGMGEPKKTFDSALAIVGEHEAESYTSKAGKEYWRTPKATAYKGSTGGTKQFKADPESRNSIEKQKALAEAVNYVNGQEQHTEEDVRLAYVLHVAQKFLEFIREPESVDVLTSIDDDKPPIENYD